ncbi:6335_t:CDS:2, partial [Racocetra persica]
MSVNSTEVNLANDKKSSQLLFFDTLTANKLSNNDELPTDRKGDYIGQTSPNKFDLHLLIHKAPTIDSAKPEKRAPLPLHPLTISFDEKKKELRSQKNKESIGASTFNEPQNNKKEHGDGIINNGTDISLEKQSMHISVLPSTIANNNNKEKFDNEASGSGKIVNKENETIIDDASSNKTSIGHNITMDGVQKERTIPFIDPTLSANEKASIEHQFSTPMDVDTFYLDVGIRDISDVERVGILLRKDRSDSFRILNPQTLANCVGLDLSDKDLLAFHSSPDETILSSTFRTFSEIEFKKAWDDFVDRIQNVDSLISALLNPNIEGIVVTNAFELERIVNLLAEVFHQISDVIIEGCLWARFQSVRYDDNLCLADKLDILYKSIIFALDISEGKSSVKLFESGLALFCKLCKCGEDFINLSLVQSVLKLVVPLLIEQHVSSILQTRVLRGLLECMEETRVVESLLGCCDKNR